MKLTLIVYDGNRNKIEIIEVDEDYDPIDIKETYERTFKETFVNAVIEGCPNIQVF